MVRGAADILSGTAEEREKRLSELLAKRDGGRERLEAESDPGRLAELLREHVAIQDDIIAELMASGHQRHHGGCPHHQAEKDSGCPHHRAGAGHYEAPKDAGGEKKGGTSDISALVRKASTAADHRKIADYYLEEAKKLRLRAAQHGALAERYRALAPAMDAREEARYCEELMGSLTESARLFDELALWHQKLATRLPGAP